MKDEEGEGEENGAGTIMESEKDEKATRLSRPVAGSGSSSLPSVDEDEAGRFRKYRILGMLMKL
uniref:Uncharacterized protein n=1 Tax=Leersia perrieri TaxID=77586 RepID=A0A0D9WX51_9ORYZ